MKLIIDHNKCFVEGESTKLERNVDRDKVWFMVRTKFRKATKRRFLGYAWSNTTTFGARVISSPRRLSCAMWVLSIKKFRLPIWVSLSPVPL
jgi:hypothetical protein